MNVLLVHHTWPGLSAGGSETYVRGLARTLAARGHAVTALHPGDEADVREDGYTRLVVQRGARGFDAWNDPGLARRVGDIVRERAIEVVHVHHLSGLSAGLVAAARAAGAAVVFTLHDFATLCALGQLLDRELRVCPGPAPERCLACVGGQVAARVIGGTPGGVVAGVLARTGHGAQRIDARLRGMRAALLGADALLSPSRFLRDRMGALGVPGIEVLPYGHEPLLRVARTPGARVRFGFLGTLIPSKGVHVLAEAFARLDPSRAELRIHGPFVPYHGDTSYERRLRERLGPHAGEALRGPFDHADRARVLAELDVLVTPSIWEENAPLVVQEAFQAGVPVVASGHGGLAEAVRDGVDGLLFRPGDPDDLARVLQRFLDDPELRARLAAQAPGVTTLDEHAPRLEEVYARARQRRERRARVGVVVVDHGRPDDARRALASAAGADIRLLVANGTDAGEPGAEVLRLDENRGYAAGANAGVQALAERGCDRALVLNNDAVLAPGALSALAHALDDPAVAAAGPTILARDGAVESAGLRLDLRTGRHRLNRRGEDRVDALSGAALMVSVRAWRALGGFDEAYFHGYEDTDFGLRARALGWSLVLVREARVEHASGATLGASPQVLTYAVRNHLRLVARLAPRRRAEPRTAWIVALHVAHALRQRRVPRWRALHAVARGVASWRAGRTGPEPA